MGGSSIFRVKKGDPNFKVISDHISCKLLENKKLYGERRYEFPEPIPTETGELYFTNHFGESWRAMTYISSSHSISNVSINNQNHLK